jgi:hypothetical protein
LISWTTEKVKGWGAKDNEETTRWYNVYNWDMLRADWKEKKESLKKGTVALIR